MKRLYARLVLWLIRPAVDAAIAESGKPGSQLWRIENCAGRTLRSRQVIPVVTRAGEVHSGAGLHLNETGQPIPSGDKTEGSRQRALSS